MAKGGIVLGIIGMLLGAGGIGFGFLAWSNQAGIQASLIDAQNQLISQNVWSISYDNIYYPPQGVYNPIPNMSLIIDLGVPVSLHLLFTSSARIWSDPSSFSDIFFHFMLDSVQIPESWTRVGSYKGTASYEYHSVVMQQFIQVISPGIYNFTIDILSENASNFIRESTFTIFSYPV